MPRLKLGFEYQGEHHFMNLDDPVFTTEVSLRQGIRLFSKVFLSSPPDTNSRLVEFDRQKRALCEARGITLIDVPYWWQREEQSLASTIASARPDLKLRLESAK